MPEEQPIVFLSAPKDEPIRLSGPPLRLAGRVRMRNPHARSFVLRNMALLDRSGRLADLAPQHAFQPVVLRPREERAAPFSISLDPLTPPGEYHVELNVSGQSLPAVLSVAEAVALRVEPQSVVVANDAAVRVKKKIILSNEGNVPLDIGDIGDVELRDDLAQPRDLRGVIGPLLEEIPKKIDDVVAALVAITSPRGPAVGLLSVRMHGDSFSLAPGRTATVELEITVPAGLAAHGRYRGRAAIQTADIEFVVTPRAGHPREKPAGAGGDLSESETKRRSGLGTGNPAKHR
jgi:hypothetical protein